MGNIRVDLADKCAIFINHTPFVIRFLQAIKVQTSNFKCVSPFVCIINIFKHFMKNLRLPLLTVAILAIVSVVACKKSKDGNSSGLSATINGASYQSASTTGIYTQGYINIAGVQFQAGDTLFLSLEIPDTAHVNNPIDMYSGRITYTKVKSQTTYEYNFNGSHGFTTLTSWDKTNKTIAGKFSGVIYSDSNTKDSIVVANGQFNTTYKVL